MFAHGQVLYTMNDLSGMSTQTWYDTTHIPSNCQGERW